MTCSTILLFGVWTIDSIDARNSCRYALVLWEPGSEAVLFAASSKMEHRCDMFAGVEHVATCLLVFEVCHRLIN